MGKSRAKQVRRKCDSEGSPTQGLKNSGFPRISSLNKRFEIMNVYFIARGALFFQGKRLSAWPLDGQTKDNVTPESSLFLRGS